MDATNRTVVIGLDLGHSAVKMTFDGRMGVERHTYPSLACQAIAITGNVEEALLAERETVTVKGERYFVGNTAAVQGRAALSSGLTDEWIHSVDHAALMALARKVVDSRAPHGSRLWILGLPVSLFAEHRDTLAETAAEYLDGTIRVVPQPMGGFQAHMLERTGTPARSLTTESWAVVDVGYYTTDFILMLEGRWVERASDSCGGVRLAAEHLQRLISQTHQIRCDLVKSERALREGEIKHQGKRVDVADLAATAKAGVAGQVSDMAMRLIGSYADDIDGVLVLGGGAEMVFDALHETWPHSLIVQDTHEDHRLSGPRYLVSEGYYRFGRFSQLLHLRQMQSAAA